MINCNLSLEQDPINGRRYNITIAIMEEEEEEEENSDEIQDAIQVGIKDENQNQDTKLIEDSVSAAIMQAMQLKSKP